MSQTLTLLTRSVLIKDMLMKFMKACGSALDAHRNVQMKIFYWMNLTKAIYAVLHYLRNGCSQMPHQICYIQLSKICGFTDSSWPQALLTLRTRMWCSDIPATLFIFHTQWNSPVVCTLINVFRHDIINNRLSVKSVNN